MAVKYPVTLHVYDLSNGLARTMSPMFLGKQVDGIWHTGICVYGEEHYFGGGLQIGTPGRTPYGAPVRVEALGETTVGRAEFMRWRATIDNKYSAATYHLLNNNCNHFTNDASVFLVGARIPAYVSDLPAEFLASPFGRAMQPMIDQMMGSMGGALGEPRYAQAQAPPPAAAAGGQALGRAAAAGFPMARSQDLIAFDKANVPQVVGKLVEFVSKSDTLAPTAGAAVFEELTAVLQNGGEGSESLRAALVMWTEGLVGLARFPLLDVWRLLCLQPYWRGELVRTNSLLATARAGFSAEADGTAASKNCLIMACRLLANAMSFEDSAAHLLAPPQVDGLLDLSTSALCHSEAAVRQVAAAVLANIARWMAADGGTLTDARVQVLMAAVECLFTESDAETVYRELLAVARSAVSSPDAAQLVASLELPMARFVTFESSVKVRQIADELERILGQ